VHAAGAVSQLRGLCRPQRLSHQPPEHTAHTELEVCVSHAPVHVLQQMKDGPCAERGGR